MEIKLVDVIDFIRPNSQFILVDDDIATLEFHDNSKFPTDEEIKDGWVQLTAIQEQKAQELAAEKAAILAKLGITENEAKLLLS